jgi:20S proteasome subunit beta 7|uniref:Proteasome subunit beta n=1 Tax=Panagrolaimus sp. PS1159 TaxID=55785 RepID=A0AC35GHY5_9BILA
MEGIDKPFTHTLDPTCTGTSMYAVVYKDGVAIATDRVCSYGKTARYKHIGRQYRVNENVIVAFGGDHADFQWLQNVIERKELDLKCYDIGAKLTPKGLHAFLTSLMYYRRSEMNPIMNTIVVAGMHPEPTYDNLVPFIGVITPRGVGYSTKHVATGLGAMLLHQNMETLARTTEYKMSRDDAFELLKKCMEVHVYRDCTADNEYDLSTITKDGVKMEHPQQVIGSWEISELNNQYE